MSKNCFKEENDALRKIFAKVGRQKVNVCNDKTKRYISSSRNTGKGRNR